MRDRRQHRRAFALTALVLWLLGVEVLPGLHLATHEGDHTHAADGTIVAHGHDHDDELARLHALAHAQAGTECLHAGARRPAKRRGQLAIDRVPHGHAAAGIAHHATALLDPPPPITAPVWAPHAETWCHAAPTTRAPTATTARPSARGPPFVRA